MAPHQEHRRTGRSRHAELPGARDCRRKDSCHNLYASGFVYCVDRAFVSACTTPCLVLAGNDEAHPWPVSEELARLLPNCEFIPEWKTSVALTSARARVREFLAKHTPRG